MISGYSHGKPPWYTKPPFSRLRLWGIDASWGLLLQRCEDVQRGVPPVGTRDFSRKKIDGVSTKRQPTTMGNKGGSKWMIQMYISYISLFMYGAPSLRQNYIQILIIICTMLYFNISQYPPCWRFSFWFLQIFIISSYHKFPKKYVSWSPHFCWLKTHLLLVKSPFFVGPTVAPDWSK